MSDSMQTVVFSAMLLVGVLLILYEVRQRRKENDEGDLL